MGQEVEPDEDGAESGAVGAHMLKVPRDQLRPHIPKVGRTKLPRAATGSLILPAFGSSRIFLAVGHALNQICLTKQW